MTRDWMIQAVGSWTDLLQAIHLGQLALYHWLSSWALLWAPGCLGRLSS